MTEAAYHASHEGYSSWYKEHGGMLWDLAVEIAMTRPDDGPGLKLHKLLWEGRMDRYDNQAEYNQHHEAAWKEIVGLASEMLEESDD